MLDRLVLYLEEEVYPKFLKYEEMERLKKEQEETGEGTSDF